MALKYALHKSTRSTPTRVYLMLQLDDIMLYTLIIITIKQNITAFFYFQIGTKSNFRRSKFANRELSISTLNKKINKNYFDPKAVGDMPYAVLKLLEK